MLEFTDWALDIIGRAHAAATRLNPAARIRLARTPAGLEPLLVESPEPGDHEIRVGEAAILVESGLQGLVDIEEPHDRIVLRPAGSPPNVREH